MTISILYDLLCHSLHALESLIFMKGHQTLQKFVLSFVRSQVNRLVENYMPSPHLALDSTLKPRFH